MYNRIGYVNKIEARSETNSHMDSYTQVRNLTSASFPVMNQLPVLALAHQFQSPLLPANFDAISSNDGSLLQLTQQLPIQQVQQQLPIQQLEQQLEPSNNIKSLPMVPAEPMGALSAQIPSWNGELLSREQSYHESDGVLRVALCISPSSLGRSSITKYRRMLKNPNFTVQDWECGSLGSLDKKFISVSQSKAKCGHYRLHNLTIGGEAHAMWSKKVKSSWPLLVDMLGSFMGVKGSGCRWALVGSDIYTFHPYASDMKTLAEYERSNKNEALSHEFCYQVASVIVQLILTGHTKISGRNFMVSGGQVHPALSGTKPSLASEPTISISSSIISRYLNPIGGVRTLTCILMDLLGMPNPIVRLNQIYNYASYLAVEENDFMVYFCNVASRLFSAKYESLFDAMTLTPTKSRRSPSNSPRKRRSSSSSISSSSDDEMSIPSSNEVTPPSSGDISLNSSGTISPSISSESSPQTFTFNLTMARDGDTIGIDMGNGRQVEFKLRDGDVVKFSAEVGPNMNDAPIEVITSDMKVVGSGNEVETENESESNSVHAGTPKISIPGVSYYYRDPQSVQSATFETKSVKQAPEVETQVQSAPEVETQVQSAPTPAPVEKKARSSTKKPKVRKAKPQTPKKAPALVVNEQTIPTLKIDQLRKFIEDSLRIGPKREDNESDAAYEVRCREKRDSEKGLRILCTNRLKILQAQEVEVMKELALQYAKDLPPGVSPKGNKELADRIVKEMKRRGF